MSLYGERKRLKELAEREAAGESFWTEHIERTARAKIALAWSGSLRHMGYGQESDFSEAISLQLVRSLGLEQVRGTPDFFVEITDPDLVFSYIEAVYNALRVFGRDEDRFEGRVNEVLNSHRIAYRMVEGEIVPLSSDELHVAVVGPTLRLLVGRDDFAPAHATYLKALKEISHEDAGDAITDAATALQEALSALGCQGNALGPLINDARKKGLLAPHDEKLASGIQKFLDWVSADRSATGDAHGDSSATLADAWLAVHVVGALILRLADEVPRPRPT